jgi:two-component system chemotaxis response regulator CheY
MVLEAEKSMMTARVLVADDDPLMCTLVAVCLADIVETRQATNGAEVLIALENADVDLLLLDWNMPAPDGLAVLKIARSRGFRMPVIMVTAETDRSRVIEAIHAGASDYLIKPFDSAVLREKVKRFCKRNTVPSKATPQVSTSPSLIPLKQPPSKYS